MEYTKDSDESAVGSMEDLRFNGLPCMSRTQTVSQPPVLPSCVASSYMWLKRSLATMTAETAKTASKRHGNMVRALSPI